jgi:hypothetical protein
VSATGTRWSKRFGEPLACAGGLWTQHLPPPAEMVLTLGVPGILGRLCGVPLWVIVCRRAPLHSSGYGRMTDGIGPVNPRTGTDGVRGAAPDAARGLAGGVPASAAPARPVMARGWLVRGACRPAERGGVGDALVGGGLDPRTWPGGTACCRRHDSTVVPCIIISTTSLISSGVAYGTWA